MLLFSCQIIESDSETSGLLGKEVRIILDSLHEALLWQESLREVLDDLRIKAKVVQIEPCSKHVRLKSADIVLTIQAEDILSRGEYEVTAF